MSKARVSIKLGYDRSGIENTLFRVDPSKQTAHLPSQFLPHPHC